MNAPICDGHIILNVDGKRYVASYRIERGVITVTSGSASHRLDIGDVENPKSVARTVLRTMVTEGRAASVQAPASEAWQGKSKSAIAPRDVFFVRPLSSSRHLRTHH